MFNQKKKKKSDAKKLSKQIPKFWSMYSVRCRVNIYLSKNIDQ